MLMHGRRLPLPKKPVNGATALALALTLFGLAAFAAEPPCTATLAPTDDVQRAVANAPVGQPAVVCLGPGEFRLRRFLAIERDDVTLRGKGGRSVLSLDPGIESPVIVVGDWAHAIPERPVRNVRIERLAVVGGGRGGSEAEPAHPYLTNSAVVVRAGRNVHLRNLRLTACRSACLLTERDTRDVTIEHNRVSGAVWDGIALNRTAKARVLRNAIGGNTAAGITTEHLESSLIAANVLRANRTHGIYLSDSSRNRIVANRFVGNVLSGVFVTCAVRRHEPPVRCWPDSMSRQNLFAHNVFVDNRVAFMVAANRAARCDAPCFARNRSLRDRLRGNPRQAPNAARYGRCLDFGP
jgi:parallel beta-helix repeat protein